MDNPDINSLINKFNNSKLDNSNLNQFNSPNKLFSDPANIMGYSSTTLIYPEPKHIKPMTVSDLVEC